MRDQSEAEDWAAVVRGDAQAFGRIFDLHQAQVFRHSRRLVDDLEDARDVVATTFLEAWRRRSSVRVVNGSVAPWLIVTATNVSRNLVRARRAIDPCSASSRSLGTIPERISSCTVSSRSLSRPCRSTSSASWRCV